MATCLKLVEEAVRRDVHVVARHPVALFACLWNSCWWHDSPAADSHYNLAADGPVESPVEPHEFAAVRPAVS